MSDHQQTSEQVAGGLPGKAAGRAKEIVGSALGKSELEQADSLLAATAMAREARRKVS